MTIGIGIYGAAGRMGRAIAAVAREDTAVEIACAVEHEGSLHAGADLGTLAGGASLGVSVTTDLVAALEACDVIIDFTTPAGTRRLIDACARADKPAVVGTTGLDDAAHAAIATLAERAPVVVAPNMSAGVTLLFHLAARAAEALGPDFDAEIVEMHHRKKVDAPSGTAVRLGDVVARAKGLDPAKHVVHGRSGQVGARPDAEVGIMTLRGGDVVGEHTLLLVGPGERLELTHRATDRAIFARGAVRAAKWAVTRPAGLYDMAAVLGLG